ncbi:MAG: LytTR family DNA-binding domain-containing protein [Defluviitaleaceae bacterium]|nr:LytTR family DNA-binding domain-containing protein [Defluviitaleaceae bacterium]
MIAIAICDDEERIVSELKNDLAKVFIRLDITYTIDSYFTGEDLCNKMKSGTHYDLIFLDIEFAHDKVNGVEVGKLIRETYLNDVVAIVFISWEKKYSMQLFDIRPLNFLTKPLEYIKVEKIIQTYLRLSKTGERIFVYKIGRDFLKAQVKDIIYVESYDRKLILHMTNNRKEEFYGTIKDVYQQLQKFDFLCIHASYVVNYDHIEMMKFCELKLTGMKNLLPISQNKRKEVRDEYCTIMERRRG